VESGTKVFIKINNKALVHIRVHPSIATPPEEDRVTATGDLHKKFVKIGPAVTEICSRTERHTDRQIDRNTPLPYGG